MTQLDLLLRYFKQRPNKEIRHPEVVDWATKEWKAKTGKVFRDPDRGIRSLYQKGLLIKIDKGIYKYNPNLGVKKLDGFSESQKREILERDNQKCSICGLGVREGRELHVDHIRPQDKGGDSSIENGQTLCSEHNFFKKNFNQTELAKKLFINLERKAKIRGYKKLLKFTRDILKVYEEHNINGHIDWSILEK